MMKIIGRRVVLRSTAVLLVALGVVLVALAWWKPEIPLVLSVGGGLAAPVRPGQVIRVVQ